MNKTQGGCYPAHKYSNLTGFITQLFNSFFDHPQSDFSIYKMFGHFEECGAHGDDGDYYIANVFRAHINSSKVVVGLGAAGIRSLSRADLFSSLSVWSRPPFREDIYLLSRSAYMGRFRFFLNRKEHA